MSQDWIANLYTTGEVVDTTMSNMELMFATLKSSFAGASTPSNAAAGQVWYDSNASYKCLQVRDSANAAWRGVMVGSSSCKVWLYLNAVEEGWTIDSSVTDKVLALKGGSTYTTGAASAGTWTVSGFSAHNHQWYDHVSLADHNSYTSAGVLQVINAASTSNDGIRLSEGSANKISGDQHTSNVTESQDGAWRPSAAVGIMAAPTARG